MNSVSHWIYFSWLNLCPHRLVFKTEQLFCGCNYQKSVWHNYVLVTEHIPGMELLGDFFPCLPVELQHRVYISFLHCLTCGNKCQAQQSPGWVPRCLWQAVLGELQARTLRGISAPYNGKQGSHLLCSWSRGGLHFENAVPVRECSQDCICPCVGWIVRVGLQSSSLCGGSHGRAPWGGHLDGGWGFEEGMVKQEWCLAAAGIPCGDFAVLSLGSTRLQWQLGIWVIAAILPLLCLGPRCTAGDRDAAGGSGHSLSLSGAALNLCTHRVSWGQTCSVPRDTVGPAAEIAEHILKWKWHLDKHTALGVLCFTLTLLWDHEGHLVSMLLCSTGISAPRTCCT